PDVLRAIGTLRPSRFASREPWDGKSLPCNGTTSWLKVKSVRSLGERRMVDIRTTTGTFIAEGFVTHNCSTVIEGLGIWKTVFFTNAIGLIVSYDSEHAADLFGIAQHIYDLLPWWLK